MRKICLLLSGAVLLVILGGCTSVKRFKSAAYKGEDNSLVDVELFNTRLSTEALAMKEKNLWTLSANAQTRLIQILDERYPENEQFIRVLSGNFGYDEAEEVLYTRKDLRMVFTISKNRDYSLLNDPKGRFSPADRIEYFSLSLEIPENYRLRFHEWNRYGTEYGEIHIADVGFSRNLDLSMDATPGGVGVESSTSLGKNEKQEVSRRFMKLNGSITDHKVLMEAEGNREVDLTGNVTAEVSLQFDTFPEVLMEPVFMSGAEGNKILSDLKFMDVLVPAMEDAPDTIFADMRLSYVYRHVDSGWLTFAEWDDRVEYYQGNLVRKVPLFLKKDYLPPFFCIGTDFGTRQLLKLQKDVEKEYLLQFGSYKDASAFLEWLQNHARIVPGVNFMGDWELLYQGESITEDKVHPLRVLPVY